MFLRSLLLALGLLLAATAAHAQASLSPPAVKWGSNGVQVPVPIQLVGYDSGTGRACIVGSTATCALATGTVTVAQAQSGPTNLSPPGVGWGSLGVQVPAPTQLVGYDSSTGAACIIGSTATCAFPVAGGGTFVSPNITGTVTGGATYNSIVLGGVSALPGGAQLTLDISQRAPNLANDYLHGYSVCTNGTYATCFWRFGSRIYQQSTSNAGYPQWAPQNAYGTQLPANAASATAYAAYDISMRVVSTYAGALFQVTRASDSTTLDIVQSWDGSANLPPMQTFCRGTTCGVSVLYDQAGANNCTQGTQALMPLVEIDPDGSVWLSFPNTTGVTTNGVIALSCSGVSLTKNAVSLAAIIRARNTGSSVNIANIGNSLQYVAYKQGGITTWGDGGFGTAGVFTGPLPISGVGVIAASGASSRNITEDGYGPGTKTVFGATALSEMTLGQTDVGSPAGVTRVGNVELQSIILWSSALSAADQQVVRTALQVSHPTMTPPQSRCTIGVDGESILQGLYQDAGQGVMEALRARFPRSVRVYNQAVSGKTDAVMLSDYAADISWIYVASNACNLLILNPGLNGIAAGETVADVENNVTAYIALAKATGWNIGVMTEISRITYDTQAGQINTWMRQNIGGLGAFLIDVAADPNFQAGGYANTEVYQNDGIHLTNAGAAELGGLIAASVLPLVSY